MEIAAKDGAAVANTQRPLLLLSDFLAFMHNGHGVFILWWIAIGRAHGQVQVVLRGYG